MNPWALIAALMWLAAVVLIVALFGINGLIVVGIMTFCGIFGVVIAMMANW